MTKLMTLLLCFEQLVAGKIHLNDAITISQALLDEGAVYPLETLLHATSIASANDAACALPKHIVGSESSFAELMNHYVTFSNCTLDANSITSAATVMSAML